MDTIAGSAEAALFERVLQHYYVAGPLIEAGFAGTPIVYANFPSGLGQAPHFGIAGVPLSAKKLEWLVHREYALEFHSWAPLTANDDRLTYARILLVGHPDWQRVKEAALAVRAQLFNEHLEAIALCDGTGGIALWIPLADAPHAPELRAWLHGFANRACIAHPALLSTEVNTHRDGRVHVHVSSNAPGHFSALPYSLRGREDLPVCTPIAWEELGAVAAVACTAQSFPQRLRAHGDVFAQQRAIIAHQRFADVATNGPLLAGAGLGGHGSGHTPEPRGHIINAAIAILNDGKYHTADDILAAALQQKLVPPETQRKYVYSALIEYIARQLGRGRKPPIVQDAQRRFRINEPLDDWPDLVAAPRANVDPAVEALCNRLETTATGSDPTAFEVAVCDAFAHLGYLTQHLGQGGQPDGVADAILGPLGYRVMLECKTGATIVNNPDAAEVARFVESFNAQFGVMVGPAFSDEIELLKELQTHKICVLDVPNLQTLLRLRATAVEAKSLFAPGYACDLIADLLWNRVHGEAKRVADVAEILKREGWKAQAIAAQQGGPANAPHLTVDAAMLVVDAALSVAGSTIACTREEVVAAFERLTNPTNGAAVLSDGALIITVVPEAALSEEALALIEGVSSNRTAFMVDASVKEALKRQRALRDAEIERISEANAASDRSTAREWEGTLGDGLEPDESFEDPYRS